MTLELLIENKIRAKIPAKKVIEGWILEVLKDKKIDADVEIGLEIVSNDVIHKFNKKYRKIDSPTDVLSFPLLDKIPVKSDKMLLLGDIFICYEILEENAHNFGVSIENEFKKLIEHGTLHLLGYHHKE